MTQQASRHRKVILVSIDGLLPDYYLSPISGVGSYLRALAGKGAYAEGALPVYPTLSMTNHATLATGVYADRHGITSNTHFDADQVTQWIGGESKDWYMDASSIQAPTLWDLSRAAGLRTALLRWPATRGARADWLIPDTFSVMKEGPSTWELTFRASTPELMQEIIRRRGLLHESDDHAQMDAWITEAASYILEKRAPDLMMIHFNSHDHEAHLHGRTSVEARQALWRTEIHLKRILSRVDSGSTTIVILGDHGYLDFTRRIHLNALFRSRGWLQAKDGRITEWKVVAHTNCGQAGIYLRDPSLAEPVLAALHENASGLFRVLMCDELRRLHTRADVLCAVDGLDGFSMGQALEGPLVEEIGETRGEHGYRPDLPQMQTGFIALGHGITPGTRLGRVRLLDVAPTIAGWMGLGLPDPDGEPLDLAA